MNQKQKFGYILTTLVILPIFMLGIFGLNTIRTELSTYQLQDKQAATNELNDISRRIVNKLNTIKGPMRRAILAINSRGTWALRCTFQKICPEYGGEGLDLVISYDEYGDQLYPPREATGQLYPENQALKNMASALSTARQKLNNLTRETSQQGVWTTYITPEGEKLIYCWKEPSDHTFCADINREWMLNTIIELLKTTHKQQVKHNLRLINATDQTLWQSADTSTEIITAERQLPNPFYFLRLAAYRPANLAVKTYPVTIIALSLPLLALLSAIAYWLFKTQREVLALADQRTAFAASVSHELRTPLANLQLYASLILSKAAREPTTHKDISKYAKVISAETTRLSELVNNALMITQGNDPGNRMKTEVIPDDIITETISHLAPLLGSDITKITYDLDAAKTVLLDRSALQQILVNLIDNARKYAAGKRIRIRSRLDKSHLKITVRDWGENFKTKKSSKLFTPFYQNENQFYEEAEGVIHEKSSLGVKTGFGLGLAVCKQLAEANEGDISCEAASPGARFIVTLKYENVPPRSKRVRKTNKEVEEEGSCIS